MLKGPDSIILFGGGLDSAAMVEMMASMGSKPMLVHFYYAQKAYVGEACAMRYFSNKYRLQDMRVEVPRGLLPSSPLTTGTLATSHAQNYLPGRNLLFASLAFPLAVRLGAERIYLGISTVAESPEVYGDCKRAFADAFNATVRIGYGEKSPRLMAPLVEQRREDYLIKAMKTEPNLFRVSFSCYEGTGTKECGECSHCATKKRMETSVKKEMGTL